jgi:hypothetical protein
MFLWRSRGDMKEETESEIIATKDQALQTKYHATKILQTEMLSKCRLCHQSDETVEHIIAACTILVKQPYIKRDNRVYTQVHFNMYKETGVKLDYERWYDHVPKLIETSREGKEITLWNHHVHNDSNIPNNT